MNIATNYIRHNINYLHKTNDLKTHTFGYQSGKYTQTEQNQHADERVCIPQSH